MRLCMDFGGWFREAVSLAGPDWVSLILVSALAGSGRFAPDGAPRMCPRPDAALAQRGVRPGTVSAMSVCAGQGGGIATERKGKAASLFFLLQPLSRPSGWEGQGSPGSRLRPSVAWPRASRRESELDTITGMSNTASLPCRPRRVCERLWEGLSRTGLAAGLKHGKAVK